MKKQRRKFLNIALCILGVITLLFGIKSIIDFSESTSKSEEVAKTSTKSRDGIVGVNQPFPFYKNKKEVERNLLENAKNGIEDQFILLQKDRLPIAEQKLFANNKDSKQYILGYLSGKKAKKYTEGETVELNRKYPYYIQWDRRWSYNKLGDVNIAIGGCGPATVSMAISGLLNDNSITPDKIAKVADEKGYFTDNGIKWSFFDYITKEFGLKSNPVSLNQKSIDAVLEKNNSIITSVKAGKFTTVGHIVLIVGKDSEGKYIINDPNSYGRTIKKWSYDELKTEIVSMWEISK